MCLTYNANGSFRQIMLGPHNVNVNDHTQNCNVHVKKRHTPNYCVQFRSKVIHAPIDFTVQNET